MKVKYYDVDSEEEVAFKDLGFPFYVVTIEQSVDVTKVYFTMDLNRFSELY